MNLIETPTKPNLDFNYLPETPLSEGLSLLKEHLFDPLACEEEMKYLVLCWMFSLFLKEKEKNKAILHFYGDPASGKSTAASLISVLINGSDRVGQQTVAAAVETSRNFPLLIEDNLEFPVLPSSLSNFFLLASTSGTRKKRAPESEGGDHTQRIRTNILTTAIDPFPKAFPELTSRTIQVRFERKFHLETFNSNEAAAALIQSRDIILSSMFTLVQIRTSPWASDLSAWQDYLAFHYPKASNERLHAFIPSFLLTLECLLPSIPYSKLCDGVRIRKILSRWIDSQASIYESVGA